MMSLKTRLIFYFGIILFLSTVFSYVIFNLLFSVGFACMWGMGSKLYCNSFLYASILIPIVIFLAASIWLFKKAQTLGLSKKLAFTIAIIYFLILPIEAFFGYEYREYKQRKEEALGRQKTQQLNEIVQNNVQIQPLSYEIEPGTLISDRLENFYFDTLKVKALVVLKHHPLFEEKSAKLYIQKKPNERLIKPLGYRGFEEAKDNFNTYRKLSESDQQFEPLPEENFFLLPEGEYEVIVLCEYCLRRTTDQSESELRLSVNSYSLGLFFLGYTEAAISSPLSN